MKIPRVSRACAAAVIVACLLAPLIPLVAEARTPSATTYLYNCSTRTERPTQIILTCADANTYVTNIVWSHWSAASAHATGILHWNTCSPTCAGGAMKTHAITFIATRRRDIKGVWLYSELKGAPTTWHSGSAIVALPTSAL